MAKKKYGRRDFLARLAKMIALASGVPAIEVRRILAGECEPVPSESGQDYSIYQTSLNDDIKTLKTLVESNRRVFENEYGRITQLEKGFFDSTDLRKLITLCRIEWLDPGDIVDSCEVVYQPGGTCGRLYSCKPKNQCNGQDCPFLMSCPKKNECPEQECPFFMICGTNRQLFGSSFFEQFKADPYVRSLYKRFQVNSSSDLASQVEQLLKQKRLAY